MSYESVWKSEISEILWHFWVFCSSELNDTYVSMNCAIIKNKPALGTVLSPNRWQVKTQCWLIFGLTIGNKIWWNFYQNTQILCQKNALKNVICKIVAILSGPQGCWAKWEIIHRWSLSISKSYTCLSYTCILLAHLLICADAQYYFSTCKT